MSAVQIHAAGRVATKGTGAGVARGCALARTGAGVYTLTLEVPLAAADGGVIVTPEVDNVAAIVTHTSDTVKTIETKALAAGQAATDSAFSFAVLKYDFS